MSTVIRSDIERSRHIVVLVHGIRTRAHWIYEVGKAINENNLVAVPTSYGSFGLPKFLFPGTFLRRKAIEKVKTDIVTAIRVRHPERISVIAHSFGTYVISQIIASSPEIKFDKIIFCGSVVHEDFPLHQYAERFSYPLLNEVGTHDYWPALAESAGWGYGSIGSNGLNDPLAETRWHKGLKHSDILTRRYCEDFWIPFIRDNKIIDGDDPSELPLLVRIIVWLPLRWIILAFIAALVFATLYFTPRIIGYDWQASFPEQLQSKVERFTFDYSGPFRSGKRIWKRPVLDRWTEERPDGSKTDFKVIKRARVNECDGSIVEKYGDLNLQIFIPDIGCSAMMLFARRNNLIINGPWEELGFMRDINSVESKLDGQTNQSVNPVARSEERSLNSPAVPALKPNETVAISNCMRTVERSTSSTKPSRQQLTTALAMTVFQGNEGCADELIDAGADINGAGDDKTFKGPSLNMAISRHQWNLAVLLLERGANPNLFFSVNGRYLTAMDMSIEYNAPKSVIELLDRKSKEFK